VTVQPLAELVDAQRRSWTLGATLFAGFGALALAVAAVGLYGVVAYDVAQRAHEMAVRMALGARERDVVRLVVGRGVALASAGIAIGVCAALAAARWVQPLLFEQPARDPLTYGVVAAILLAVACLASATPARRAARTEPSEALRAEGGRGKRRSRERKYNDTCSAASSAARRHDVTPRIGARGVPSVCLSAAALVSRGSTVSCRRVSVRDDETALGGIRRELRAGADSVRR
jgi:hypothetical protein